VGAKIKATPNGVAFILSPLYTLDIVFQTPKTTTKI